MAKNMNNAAYGSYRAAGKQVFIKYQNRKLYDTQASKYITVRQLGKLPVGSFIVLESTTKEDITSQTLLSALTEHFNDNPADFQTVQNELVTKFLSST